MGVLGNVCQINIRCNRGFSQLSLQDVQTRLFVGKRDVDKLIKTTRTQQGRIDLVWTVGSTNDKDVLLKAFQLNI